MSNVQRRHLIQGCSPQCLSSDNDPLLLNHQWQANLRILGADEIKTVPYTPLSHPFVERLIGTIRREYLDQVLFWNAGELEQKLEVFGQHYNTHRSMARHHQKSAAIPSSVALIATNSGGKRIIMEFSNYP